MVSPEQLVQLKEIFKQHPGPIPVFLLFLDTREDGILAVPRELALMPSPELAAAVNRLFGYPALSL
jgi:hypothetical protein